MLVVRQVLLAATSTFEDSSQLRMKGRKRNLERKNTREAFELMSTRNMMSGTIISKLTSFLTSFAVVSVIVSVSGWHSYSFLILTESYAFAPSQQQSTCRVGCGRRSIYCHLPTSKLASSTHWLENSGTVWTVRSWRRSKLSMSSQPSSPSDDGDDDNNNDFGRNFATSSTESDDGTFSSAQNAQSIKKQAELARLEAERMEAKLTLDKIDNLERQLQAIAAGIEEENQTKKQLERLVDQIEILTKKVGDTELLKEFMTFRNREDAGRGPANGNNGVFRSQPEAQIPTELVTTSTLSPASSTLKPPLSSEDVKSTASYIDSLPMPVRETLAKAVGYEEGYNSVVSKEQFVRKLYEQSDTLTPNQLTALYESTLKSLLTDGIGDEDDEESLTSLMKEWEEIWEGSEEELKSATTSTEELFWPRVIEKEGKIPTERDVNIFLNNVLDNTMFAPTEKIPYKFDGGYMIFGKNQMKDGMMLVEAMDSKIRRNIPEWDDKFQVCLVKKPLSINLLKTSPGGGDDFSFDDLEEQALLITTKDLAPTTSRWILSFVSSAAMFGAFVFAVGTFSTNDMLTQRLTEMNAMGDYSGLTLINQQIFTVLWPMAAIQAGHEFAHLGYAWADKIKTSPPTILPSLALPFLGCQTQIKTSPRNRRALFDFAFLGPMTGILLSLVVLILGLQLTLTADSESAQYLPSLPVSFLKLSSLGGTIVDMYFGGNGFILNEDPATNISLHPFAIAGFTSLMINGLEFIPYGSTDGGRVSQSVFGRFGHALLGVGMTIALIVAMIFQDPRDIFLGYLIVNSFAQKDQELPCRDEVKELDLVRVMLGFLAWVLAALILFPIS